MAKKDKIDVNRLEEKFKSWGFGTKMPGKENSNEQRSEDQLVYTQMIMGSLASLVWGEKSVTKNDKVKTLLGHKDNIYNLINTIKNKIVTISEPFNGDNINNFFKSYDESLKFIRGAHDQIENLYRILNEHLKDSKLSAINSVILPESIDKIIENINNKLDLKFQLSIGGNGTSELNTLIDNLSKFSNEDTKRITNALNSLISLVNVLSNDKLKKDIKDKANENIRTIADLINDNKTGLGAIFKGLEEATNDVTINANLESLSLILDALISIISIDKEKINDKGLKELVKITNNGGLIDTLIEQLSTITDEAIINEKNIITLGSFFESITKVGDIGLIKRYKIKSNLAFFSKFITKDIPIIFDELIKVSEDADAEDKLKAMAALGDFFLGIFKIADIDSKRRKQLKNNLEYIKYNLLDALTGKDGVITAIIESINEASKEFGDTSKNLGDIFDKLFKIADFSFKDLILLEIKLSYLSNIFKEQITGGNGQYEDALIPTLLHIQGLKFIKERIDTLENTFDLVKNLFEILPSLKDILLSTAKLKIIDANFRLYDSIINKIDSINIDDKLIEKVEKLVNTVNSINKLTNVSIGAKLSSIGFDAMISTTEKLKAVIDVYHDIDEKDIKKALDTNKQFTKLIMVSAFILIAGTLLMGQINIGKLIVFTAALTFFTFTIALTYKLIGKHLDDSIEIAESFIHLMALSSLILLAGAFFTRLIDVKDLFAFAYVLSAFLLMISGTFLLIGGIMDDVIDIAKDITELIKISAAMLMIGGLYMKLFGPKDAAAFAILLGSFILGITAIFTIASRFIKGSLSVAKDFSYLIAISTLSLILGALFISNPKRALGAIAFAIILRGFIFSIVKTFKSIDKDLKLTMATALAITALVGVSALILLIGGLFMKDLDRAIGAIAFALLLDAFIGILLYTFKKNSNIAKAIPVAVALGIVTIISSIALLVGGWLIMNNTDLLWAIPAFGVLLFAFTWVMCKTLSYASKNAKDIYIGASIMAILGGLVFEMGFAFRSLIETSKMIDDWATLIGTVVLMGGVLLGLTGLAYLIANSGSVGMIALATAIIDALIGCVALMGIGIQEIAKGIEDMAKVSHMDVDLTNLAKLLVGLAMLTGPLMGLSGLLIPIGLGAASMKALRVLLSDAAFVVQSYASLTIPMYDENGKFKGFKQMSESDIDVAMDNVKLVVTSLFGAIKEVYEQGKPSGMFDFSLTSLLTGGGGTIYGKVAVAGKGLAVMLSELAVSVKQWCDLKIPIYEGEKIIGYKTLDDSAFKTAGENIQKVVTCLGQAVIDVYNHASDKSMFDYQFGIFGDSPFEKVSKSMIEMGKMLSSVAVGVKEWSDLKIPIYKGTEVVGYQTLGNGNFKTAAKNIKKVLKCIGKALINTVANHKDIFGDDMFKDGPAIVAAKAMKIMGETLNLTALAVASYASGEFPIFDKDGKIIDKLIVNEGTITNAKTAIQDILQCIGNAIVNVVKNNDEIFSDGIFKDSPAVKAAEAIKGMSDALNNTITAIEKLSKLEIDDLKAALNPSNDPKYANNVYHKLVDVLNFTVLIYKLFAAPDKDSYGTGFWGGSLSFAEYLDKYNGDIEDANEALETFTNMLSTMLSNYSKIGKIVLDNQKALAMFKSGKGGVQSPIYKYLNSSLITVSSIITLFANEDKLDLFDKIEDNEKDINKGLSATSNICVTLLNNIAKVKEISDKLSGFNLRKIIPLINSFNACIITLGKIGTNTINKGDIKITLPEIDAKSIYDKIRTYSLALNMILKIAEYSKNIGEEGYNTLRDGILTLSAITEKIKTSENFKRHTNDLNDYIKTINSINLSKLMNLQLFVNSLNKLSRRLGNLDNLTDAIANKLSAVLFELVKQLTKADASINNAHQLQENRKKLIEESMNKISNLMSQHMIVEITQVSEDNLNSNNNQIGHINGNPITNNEGYQPNNNSSSNNSESKLQSPENVGNDKQVKINKRSESDLDEFKRWMINEYTNDLVKKIKQ